MWNLFLGGSGEAGVFTSSLFGIENVGPGITGLEERKKEEEKKREMDLQKERDENRFQRKYGVKSNPLKKQMSETSSKDEDFYDSEDTESEEEEGGAKDGSGGENRDKIRNTVGVEDSLKANKKKLNRELLQHTEVEKDLRRLTLGLLLRLARCLTTVCVMISRDPSRMPYTDDNNNNHDMNKIFVLYTLAGGSTGGT